MVSLILQNLYREILTVADENGGRLKNRVVFFADELGMDFTQVDETKVTLQPHEALQTFRGELPEGAIRSAKELENLIKTFK